MEPKEYEGKLQTKQPYKQQTIYSKTCLKRNAIIPVFFSVFTGFRFTKGCVLIKQSTKNMIAQDYNEGII